MSDNVTKVVPLESGVRKHAPAVAVLANPTGAGAEGKAGVGASETAAEPRVAVSNGKTLPDKESTMSQLSSGTDKPRGKLSRNRTMWTMSRSDIKSADTLRQETRTLADHFNWRARDKMEEESRIALLKRVQVAFRNNIVWKRNQGLDESSRLRQHSRWFVHPERRFRRMWDVFVLLFVVYNAFSLPYVLAFQPTQSVMWLVFDYLVDVFFIVDVAVNFMTGYMNVDKVLVRDSKTIARHYLRGWFGIDFLSCLPIELVASLVAGRSLLAKSGTSRELQLVSALKCIRLFRLGRFLKMLQRFKFANMWGILRLYVFVLMTCHWMACGWYSLTYAEAIDVDPTVTTWLEASDLQDESLQRIYLSCLMTSLLMLFRTITVPPQTDMEILYMTIAVLVGACLHATIFGQVAHLVSSMNAGASMHTQIMQEMHERMRYHNLPSSLANRVATYYDSLWDRQRAHGVEDTQAITNGLSEPLQKEVLLVLNRDMVEKVPMFRDTDKNVILSIIVALKTHMFLPGDYIVRVGEVGARMYFIRKGRCVVLIPVADGDPDPPRRQFLSDESGARYKAVKMLHEGDYFGEISLLFRMQRTATVCATVYTDASSLSAEAFEQILDANPDFAEQIESGFSRYNDDGSETDSSDGVSEDSESGMVIPHYGSKSYMLSTTAGAQSVLAAKSARSLVRGTGASFRIPGQPSAIVESPPAGFSVTPSPGASGRTMRLNTDVNGEGYESFIQRNATTVSSPNPSPVASQNVRPRSPRSPSGSGRSPRARRKRRGSLAGPTRKSSITGGDPGRRRSLSAAESAALVAAMDSTVAIPIPSERGDRRSSGLFRPGQHSPNASHASLGFQVTPGAARRSSMEGMLSFGAPRRRDSPEDTKTPDTELHGTGTVASRLDRLPAEGGLAGVVRAAVAKARPKKMSLMPGALPSHIKDRLVKKAQVSKKRAERKAALEREKASVAAALSPPTGGAKFGFASSRRHTAAVVSDMSYAERRGLALSAKLNISGKVPAVPKTAAKHIEEQLEAQMELIKSMQANFTSAIAATNAQNAKLEKLILKQQSGASLASDDRDGSDDSEA